jgi:hypothetical protein
MPLCAALLAISACSRAAKARTFSTPEEAARTLIAAVKAGNLPDVIAVFGTEGQQLVDSSEPVIARRNQQVFAAAAAEGWQLADQADGSKVLVVGHENWPFPVPIVKDGNAWRFDTAAGREEILARRVGRNELAAIAICRTYIAAQKLYAHEGHDGHPAGVYAKLIRSEPGRQNGLYWSPAPGRKRSPLGDLMADAAVAADRPAASPFHGYYFRLIVTQDPPALVAWPAEYDVTGVMTFLVTQDGVREKDLGAQTDSEAKAMAKATDQSDTSWTVVK